MTDLTSLAPGGITVIVRTKDRPLLLTEALASLAGQELRPSQVVVVNDGGVDVGDRLSAAAPLPFDYIDLQPGRGRSSAANAGLDAATGNRILFLDDDDWLEPQHLAVLANALDQHPEAVAAYSGVRCVLPDTEQGWREHYVFNQPFDRSRLLAENFIPIHAVLFRNSPETASGLRMDETLDTYEDWDFWLRLSARGPFTHVDRITANYRIWDTGGFGAARETDRERVALATFFGKWRQRWTEAELLDLIDAAKHRPMYHELRELLARQDRELHGALAEVESLSGALTKVAELSEQLHQVTVEKNQLGVALRQVTDERDDLLEERWRQQSASADLIWLRDRLQAHLDELHASTSWRLTAPLRRLVLAGRMLRRELPTAARRGAELLRREGLRATLHHAQAKLRRRAPRLGHAVPEGTAPTLATPVRLGAVSTGLPELSLVMLADGGPEPLLPVLGALHASNPSVPWELLVLATGDASAIDSLVEPSPGVRILPRNPAEAALAAFEGGARLARGRWLLFLGASCQPEPATLDALVTCARDGAGLAAVSPRLVDTAGGLRSAGSILWRNGMVSHYGQGSGDPAHPEYLYRRPLDSLTGEAFLVRRDVLLECGGIDPELAAVPSLALADLVLRMQKQGHRALYDPFSVIAVPAAPMPPPDTDSPQYGALRHAFRERWRTRLAEQPSFREPPRIARDRCRRRVLIIDVITPMQDQDSGSLRMVRLMEVLVALGCKVTFVPTNLEFCPPYTEGLQKAGIEVLYAPAIGDIESVLRSRGHEFDAVLVSRLIAADRYLPRLRPFTPDATLIYDTVDLHYLRERRAAQLANDAAAMRRAEETRQREIAHMERADVTLVVSPVEQEMLRSENGRFDVRVVSNIHDPHPNPGIEGRPFDQRSGMVFIGGFNHPPNEDAMLWFASEIWPRVRTAIPGVRMFVVGSRPTRAVQQLGSEDFVVTGFVRDIEPFFRDCRVSVAPLRYGAGVKGKVNTAMAYGLPVVVTSIAGEGMWLEHGVNALLADDAEGFAEQVIRLYTEEPLWSRLSAAGPRHIEQHFSRAAARNVLADILAVKEPADP